MKTLYYLLPEYILILRLHLQALWKRPPAAWSKGNAGDVVLIPGFAEPWTFLTTIAGQLNALGYRVHTVAKLNYNTQPVAACVEVLHKYIQGHSLERVFLLAHSKGGLVAKGYLDAHPEKVEKVITVSTPFQGTWLGKLWICNLQELRPGSLLITTLLRKTPTPDKLLNLYARIDNHIIPNKNTQLPGAVNVEIPVVGHTRIVEDVRTQNSIKNYVTETYGRSI